MNNTISIRLLVVEDDEDDYILLISSLRSSSFNKTVLWADSYNRAKEIISTHPIDIVIVDYRLGVHTGIELVQFISDNFPFIPAILVTGLQASALDEEALKSGAYDYLVKGRYTSEDIDRSIRYAIEKANTLKSLKESENKFKGLFENAIEYVFVVDHEMNVLDINKSALHLFECKNKEQLLGHNISGCFFPDVFEVQRYSNSSSIEIELSIPELKKRRYCILNLTVVDSTKHQYQMVLHDITERIENEQREKLLEKQSLTGKVARVIAHEIKNPLTNIQLSIEELRAIYREKGEVNDETHFLEIIERNSNRINLLIEDLLNATRFDTMSIRELDLQDLIDESIAQVKDRARLKEIEIVKQTEETIRLKGDREKLVIALLNIMVNAIEAMEESRGVLRIRTSRGTEMAEICIEDNGTGISQEDVHHLFEPFYTSKHNGTGLGLTASYTIITKHDGVLKVNSELNRGTQFYVYLPLLKE